VFLNTENISAFVGFSWKIEIEMHGATMKIRLKYNLMTRFLRRSKELVQSGGL
jgi:hypothetical protein